VKQRRSTRGHTPDPVARAPREALRETKLNAAERANESEALQDVVREHALGEVHDDRVMTDLVLPVLGVRAFDDACVQKLGLSIELLMEHAGASVAAQARRMLLAKQGPAKARRSRARVMRSGASVIVLVGPGNNGGDGAVAARLLAASDLSVTLCVVSPASACSELCQTQVERARRAGVRTLSWAACERAMAKCPLVIDAMFGAGLSRPLRGSAAKACKALACRTDMCEVLAVDVPTGMQGDSGEALGGLCVRADVTLCLTARKPCTLVAGAQLLCGRVVVGRLPIVSRTRYDAMLRAAGAVPVKAWDRAQLLAGQALQPALLRSCPSRRSRSRAR
jgi:hydroxyethylthiazole kinase-like uncharacterized protein yjeF